MRAPRVSVVMSVFNGEAYLQAALDSVLAQSFSDFELLAVNDGSTDNTAVLLAAAAAQDDRVVEVASAMLQILKRSASTRIARGKIVLQRQIETTDRQIDQLAYDLYRLSGEEIAIVEEATR